MRNIHAKKKLFCFWDIFKAILYQTEWETPTYINPIDFSLKQNITRLVRQAFIHYCELHQVWEQPSITAIIYVARTL